MPVLPENIFTATSDALILITDPSLDAKTAGLCDLLVLIEDASIQFALLEKRSNQFLALEVFRHASNETNTAPKDLLSSAAGKSKLLRNYEFSKARIGITSSQYTLVPEALHRPGDEASYFHLNFRNVGNTTVYPAHISSFHLYSIFGIDADLQKSILHLFQEPKLLHHSESVLSDLSLRLRTDAGKQVWLNVRESGIDVCVTDGRKLILLNSFERHNNEDTLYYVLFTYEQLGLDPESTPLNLSGEIEQDSALYNLLYNYIRNLRFAERLHLLSFSPVFSRIPSHFYSTLFSLAVCG
jgi:hypothetical protein